MKGSQCGAGTLDSKPREKERRKKEREETHEIVEDEKRQPGTVFDVV